MYWHLILSLFVNVMSFVCASKKFLFQRYMMYLCCTVMPFRLCFSNHLSAHANTQVCLVYSSACLY